MFDSETISLYPYPHPLPSSPLQHPTVDVNHAPPGIPTPLAMAMGLYPSATEPSPHLPLLALLLAQPALDVNVASPPCDSDVFGMGHMGASMGAIFGSNAAPVTILSEIVRRSAGGDADVAALDLILAHPSCDPSRPSGRLSALQLFHSMGPRNGSAGRRRIGERLEAAVAAQKQARARAQAS